jgi:hypothetical protein
MSVGEVGSNAVRGRRRGATTGGLLAGAASLVAVLAACAAPVAGTGSEAPVPLGTRVFANRPAAADCSKVDMTGLARVSAVSPPTGQAGLIRVDPAKPDLVWATCTGRSTPEESPGASPSPTAAAASSGELVWLVSFATSEAATSDSERMATTETESGFRALVRPARLGDAKAQVVMDVHADDHQTLLVVTVFDPRTGRPAAKCGLAAAKGEYADEAANWCLQQLSTQLMRRGGGATAAPSSTGG